MAELQVHAQVPARWRIWFAAVLVLAFIAAGILLSKTEPPAPRDTDADAGRSARIRLQTAAVAFSCGKLEPRVLILTDDPGLFLAQDEEGFPEFRKFEPGLTVVDPVSVPEWGVGNAAGFRSLFAKRSEGSGSPEGVFDVVLLDCAFPARLFSRKTLLWSVAFFDMIRREYMNPGGVFAVVLPQDRPTDSACILASMRHTFGSVGAFCFGPRVILASGAGSAPVFDLDELNRIADLAGYYSAGSGVPDNAISLVLYEDFSDSIPAGLLESAYEIRTSRHFTPGTIVYARSELLPKLKRLLPEGFPLQAVCAWLLGIVLAVYPVLRYFISWKPVHKQAFLAFEDMFYFTGVLALYLMFSHEGLSGYGVLPGLLVLFALGGYGYRTFFRWGGRVTRESWLNTTGGRVLLYLVVLAAFGLAFWCRPSGTDPQPASFLQHVLTIIPPEISALIGLGCAAILVRSHLEEPVERGPAIPVAFVLGTVAAIGLFCASVFFPAGLMVFALVVCGARIVYFDV